MRWPRRIKPEHTRWASISEPPITGGYDRHTRSTDSLRPLEVFDRVGFDVPLPLISGIHSQDQGVRREKWKALSYWYLTSSSYIEAQLAESITGGSELRGWAAFSPN